MKAEIKKILVMVGNCDFDIEDSEEFIKAVSERFKNLVVSTSDFVDLTVEFPGLVTKSTCQYVSDAIREIAKKMDIPLKSIQLK